MSQDVQKQAVAKAAIEYIVPGEIVGVGTGSTANFFIEALAKMKDMIRGAVASSEETARRLKMYQIPVFELNEVESIPVYVDGADEITLQGAMIKGGGGALTREKIVAAVAKQFVCIADQSKLVDVLGKFMLPVEVIPMAQNVVIRHLIRLGGQVHVRMKEGRPFITDNNNIILDVANLHIVDPIGLECEINQIPGVVTVGLFAKQGASICLLGGPGGVEKYVFKKEKNGAQ